MKRRDLAVCVTEAEKRMSTPPNEPGSPLSRFVPYIAPETRIPEMSFLPIVVGTLLGMIFGASSL
jgi:hypothetical protein